MLRKNRLFTPGPTPLLPAAQTAMAAFSAHHRTADFRALFTARARRHEGIRRHQERRAGAGLSGTGVMEARVSNLTSPGDKVLVLTAGKFGERWTALAKAFGCNVDVLSAPYGETFSLDEVKSKLTPDVQAVYCREPRALPARAMMCTASPSWCAAWTTPCWWWTPSPAWAPPILTWMAGASTSSSADRRKR